NWVIGVIGMLLVTMTTVAFYFITAYTPTFGREVLKLSNIDGLIVTMCVGVVQSVLAASDGGGFRPSRSKAGACCVHGADDYHCVSGTIVAGFRAFIHSTP